MSSFRETIDEQLKTNRPNLNEKTTKTYVSLLFNLHKKLEAKLDDISWFQKEKNLILKHLENIPNNSRKTLLSALYVLTNDKEYQNDMIKLCKIVNDEYKTQTKSEKQDKNWISMDEIKAKYEIYLDKVKSIFSSKTIGDYSTVVRFFLLAFLSGSVEGLEPRRSMDYGLMKIRNYEPKTDNFYKGGKFYFNQYKTSSTYGLKIIPVPKLLNVLLKKWIKLNPTEYMLFSKSLKPLSSSQISKILNKIFDKNVSVDMLRHIYLSNMYHNLPELKQMEKTASNMGHSLTTALEYIKK